MRVFKNITYVHVPKKIWEKLDSKSLKCIFLGYSQESKTYKLWDVDKNQVVMSRNVLFNEEGNLTTSTCKANSSPSVTTSHNYLHWFQRSKENTCGDASLIEVSNGEVTLPQDEDKEEGDGTRIHANMLNSIN
jgi:hypothetical protein